METYQLQVSRNIGNASWISRCFTTIFLAFLVLSCHSFWSNFIQFGREFDAFSGDLLCQLPGDIRVRYLSWDLVENHHSLYDLATFRHVWYWLCHSFSICHINIIYFMTIVVFPTVFPMFHSSSLSFMGFNRLLFLHCFFKSRHHPRTVEDAPVAFHARFSATGKTYAAGWVGIALGDSSTFRAL